MKVFKKGYRRAHVITAVFSLMLINTDANATPAHSNLTWSGYSMCLQCHTDKANEVHASTHYQWEGEALYMVNGDQIQGKLTTSVNSYCGNIIGNWGCSSCHVGLGKRPDDASLTPQQHRENIDCLICHQKDYKRKKNAVTGLMEPNEAAMTISMDTAVRTVHKPARANCIQCHANGGGGDNFKRGDLAVAHANTADVSYDVHMATAGANLNCQACHITQQHKIAGRGSDLRQTDLDVDMSCTTCHQTKLNPNGHATSDVNKHVDRVACQTCHIKTYARNASDTAASEATETHRDWSHPEWHAGNNRYEPTVILMNNLKPEYRFWNGTSWGYSLKETAWKDPKTNRYATSRPIGSISGADNSKLFPFKYKTAKRPYANNPGILIPVDTKVYFGTGNADQAIKSSLSLMGYSSSEPYSWVEDDTLQLITHEVMTKANALTCSDCHTSSAPQMNLMNDLGYNLKAAQSTVCAQCHRSRNSKGYVATHSRHVDGKKYDCSWCHTFSRPERNLSKP
jgi:hypothetical protein